MIIVILIFAIVIGSFLNVCIYRIPKEMSITYPPSSCGSCNHKLSWKELFPIIGYVFFKGHCRYCKEKISLRYPFVEILSGMLILFLYYKFDFSIIFIKYTILVFFLIVISFIDYDTTDVYTSTTYPLIVIGLIFLLIENMQKGINVSIYLKNIGIGILGAIICTVVIGLICYLTGAMGEGDIEIAAACGMFIGWKLSIFMLLFSFIIGGLISVSLIIAKKKKRTDYIAFGPSIAIATYLVVILGADFIGQYIYRV
ncbi:MAG: prepilin peptidase [Sarcina sp.]